MNEPRSRREGTGSPEAPESPDAAGAPTAPAEPQGPAEPGVPSEPELLSRTALAAFRLNGQFLAAAEAMARPAGLTAAWWQVLGAVLREPLPVAGIARAMGVTRQSVQRVADLLAGRGLAEYIPNPAHRRAKLLRPTEEGRAAVRRIDPAHAEFARRLAGSMGPGELEETVRVLERLVDAMDTIGGR